MARFGKEAGRAAVQPPTFMTPNQSSRTSCNRESRRLRRSVLEEAPGRLAIVRGLNRYPAKMDVNKMFAELRAET